MRTNNQQRKRGFDSKPIELGSSYSPRSRVISTTEKSKFPNFDGNAAPVLAPVIEPKRKADKKQVVTKKFEISKKAQTKPEPSLTKTAVKLFVSCVFVFAIVGFLNITFISMAVAASTQAEAITEQISDEREAGKVMEVEYGTLSNPTSIKEKAAALDMEAPTDVIQINLKDDSVITKEDGTIALCSTLKAVVN